MKESTGPLKGKTTLITGASSGIGAAIAAKFIAHGANVYGVSRDPSRLSSNIHPLQANIRNPEEIRQLFQQMPAFDILINNAGKAYLERISDGDWHKWDEMWETNVRALALCCQLALPKISPTGIIINISSLSGHRVPPSGGFYAPTKFAVKAITEALRLELRNDGSAIRVGSISPGFVDTPLLDDYLAKHPAKLQQQRQQNSMLLPVDVAAAALHMATTPDHVEIGNLAMRCVQQTV